MHGQLAATRDVLNDIRQIEAALSHTTVEGLLGIDAAVQDGVSSIFCQLNR